MSAKTFRQLFVDGSGVVIPMIQRDYAQGREDPRSASVLAGFLDALLLALTEPGGDPVDLDFIYGRWDPEKRALEPLDGQQRLTTLFLLHWFLAQQDGRQAELREWMQESGKSRFGYRTRPSAEEFIDALVAEDVDVASLAGVDGALSAWITDRSWFLRAWRRDPTVRGCLSALSAIARRFQGLRDGFAVLVDDDNPRVVFHELLLHEFGLSDDLYVKMNARGRSLTSFEVFKAELEELIEVQFGDEPCRHDPGMSWKAYVSHQFDGEWTDFLWSSPDGESSAADGGVDGRFMQLLRLAMLLDRVLRPHRPDEDLEAQIDALLSEAELSVSFFRDELGGLDRGFVERLVALLDALARGSDGRLGVLGRVDYFDEDRALAALYSPPGKGRFGLSTPEWAKLASFAMFLLARSDDLRTKASRAACHEWMRVVCNLVDNSEIDRLERLVGALQSVAAVHQLGAGDEFLRHVEAAQFVWLGFSREQREQERLKAELINSHTGWRGSIEGAEAHTYLRGDLRFVLRASLVWDASVAATPRGWSDREHQRLQAALGSWVQRVCAVFPPDRRERAKLGDASEHLWERALLCHGDYLLPSRRNQCLVNDGDTDPSWKRLLQADIQRPIVQAVLGGLDLDDVAGSLRAMIDGARMSDMPLWQRWLIREPRLIRACRRRMLRFEDNGVVHLLWATQRNGYSAELHVYALYLVASDLGLDGYESIAKPKVRGGGGSSTLRLQRTDGGGRLCVTTEAGQQVFRVAAGTRWADEVERRGYAREGDDWVRRVSLERGEAELLSVLGVAGG